MGEYLGSKQVQRITVYAAKQISYNQIVSCLFVTLAYAPGALAEKQSFGSPQLSGAYRHCSTLYNKYQAMSIIVKENNQTFERNYFFDKKFFLRYKKGLYSTIIAQKSI